MTTRERREYSSSNVVRTLHPSRPLSPSQQVKVDHNLDYLLDDLQNSVERSRSAATKDVHYLSPSNTSTVVRERSVSPGGGESRRVYKTAHYEYSTSSGANQPVAAGALDVQQNINSLDSLLQDLKHERERSLERHDTSYSNVGIDDGLLEPSSHVTKTTKTYTTSGGPVSQTGVNRQTTTTVNRELNFDSPLNTTTTTKSSTLRQSRSRQRSPAAFDTHVTRDVSYDSDPTVDNLNSNTTTINRSYNTYSSSASGGTQPQPHQVVPYNEFVEEVDASTLPAELSGLPMASGILPGPGTKVTTTIKTFTYEIPGDAPAPVNQSYHYKTDTYNSTNNVQQQQQHIYPPAPAERDIPSPQPGSTTIYKNETYNTINRSHVHPSGPYGPGSHDVPPPRRSVSPVTNTKSVIVKRETHNTSTTSNVHPVPAAYPVGPTGPNTNTTYMYKQDIRNTNTTNTVHPAYPAHPPADMGPTTVVYEVSPGAPQPGPKQTYMYKREVTNTKNTVYGPPGGHGPAQPIVEYPDTLPRSHGPAQPAHPAGPTTVVYNYTSTNTNTRNVHGHPDDGSRQPLLPFPVNGQHPSQVDGNPPKRLDDLLATFGDTNGHGPNHRGGIEEPYTPRKEINTALTTGKAEPIVEPKATMKPIAGPPVYYPQGKEVSMKGEQSEAAWRAQGGWAKASGNYEYEAASKSKSSSKSGAAVVPVCLPLCCAMPCSIM